jgi:SAM-dependent methyltransferase
MTFLTIPDPSVVNNVDPHREAARNGALPQAPAAQRPPTPPIASGVKAQARAILAAIRTLQAIEQAQRPATPEEREVLAHFPGFGPVALGIFPDPVTGQYRDAGWQQLGDELQALLSPEDYASARRTTFTAFYTAPVVMQAMYAILARLGVPAEATVLEPGCGIGNFLTHAPAGMRFIGVELDRLSGRIARVLHPDHDIRIEHFRDTCLPEGAIDAVIGNVPFADLRLDYHGIRLALHDFFLAKSLDALKPGGVLALVTSHYTLDKQHPGLRTQLAQHADFLGAIRLPAEAFAQQGTRVVTDILCLRKRAPGEETRHADPAWLETAPLAIEGVESPINRYFLQHPAMVLGTWSRHDRLYAGEGYTLRATGGPRCPTRRCDPAPASGRVLRSPQRAGASGLSPTGAAPAGAPPHRRQFLCHGDQGPHADPAGRRRAGHPRHHVSSGRWYPVGPPPSRPHCAPRPRPPCPPIPE